MSFKLNGYGRSTLRIREWKRNINMQRVKKKYTKEKWKGLTVKIVSQSKNVLHKKTNNFIDLKNTSLFLLFLFFCVLTLPSIVRNYVTLTRMVITKEKYIDNKNIPFLEAIFLHYFPFFQLCISLEKKIRNK